MSISKHECEVSLEEKIKLYLDIWVGSKAGHTLLDTAKETLVFDMGMDYSTCPYCHKRCQVLSLEKRIEIATFILSKRINEKDVDKELLNLPQSDVKNDSEFVSEYWKQIRLAIEVQHINQH